MENESLRILLIGNGGREHALAWKLEQSPRVDHIFVVPGNGGTARGMSKVENITHVKPDDYLGLVAFARDHEVNLVIPGPEAPLVDGIEGYFRTGEREPLSYFSYRTVVLRLFASWYIIFWAYESCCTNGGLQKIFQRLHVATQHSHCQI